MYDSAGGRTKKPNNVIKGEFARPGQTDWAVLCSVKSVSTILAFWNGSENNPAAIAPSADSNYVQNVGDGQLAYDRADGHGGTAPTVPIGLVDWRLEGRMGPLGTL
jgi:hypothetical protein